MPSKIALPLALLLIALGLWAAWGAWGSQSEEEVSGAGPLPAGRESAQVAPFPPSSQDPPALSRAPAEETLAAKPSVEPPAASAGREDRPRSAGADGPDGLPAPNVVIRWAAPAGSGKPDLSRFMLRVDGRRWPPNPPGTYFPVYYDPARWVVRDLPPGRHLVWFVAPAPGAKRLELCGHLLELETPEGTEPARQVQFAGRPVASLAVAVADADSGKPVKGATVELRWDGRLLQAESSNEYGAANLFAPTDRPVSVLVTAEGFAAATVEAANYGAGTHRLPALALQPLK